MGWKFSEYNLDSVRVRIRFDEEKPDYYYFYTSAHKDNPSEVYIGFERANNIIAKLKKAKRLRIQAGFNNDGLAISEFNIAGLKWDHFGKDNPPAKHSN